MGLLDSVLGAVSNASQAQGASLGGGLGGLLGTLTGHPQLLQTVSGLLGNDGAHGGLDGLVAQFQQAGLGDVIGSWIGSGPNLPVSGDQLAQVLGSGALDDVAAKLGLNPGDAAHQLSQWLPAIVNHLTPSGQAPQGGLGHASELMGMLGQLLAK